MLTVGDLRTHDVVTPQETDGLPQGMTCSSATASGTCPWCGTRGWWAW
jgi:hypothetical protein